MKKNILVLTSSPRKKGNSDMMADAFIRGAESVGHTVNKYEAAFTKISETALLLCGGDSDIKLFSGAIETYKHISERFQWNDRGMVVATGVMDKGAITGTDYLKKSEELGKSMK